MKIMLRFHRSWFTDSLGILLLLVAVFVPGSIQAQTWKKLHTFDGYICFTKFLDASTGFVGLGVSPGRTPTGPVAVYKTTDGGTTWIQATIPSGYGGEIGDILMVDSQNGWLAMTVWGGSGNKALWRTSDGGLTWNETQLVGSGTSVNITPNAMIVTDIFNKGHISTDNGNTFSNGFLSSTNCVNFVDALHGVISDYRGENWLYSADGGLTWKNSNMQYESWSVYSDSVTSNFYAAPEGSLGHYGTIYRSTDYGATWGPLAQFPFIFTGHLAGLGEQNLFFQVDTSGSTVNGVTYEGFYYSSDKGINWTSIGGPCAFNDTRFSVLNECSGITLFGFDCLSPGTLYQYSFGSGNNVSQPAHIHREAASAYFGQIDSLTLGVDLPSQLNIDSLWPFISDIQFTYTWDSSVVNYYSYAPPPAWGISSINHGGNSARIDIQNNASTVTQPLNLGTALFRPRSTQLSTSWVELPSFVINVGTQALSLCVTDNEDNHWAVKTLGELSGVSEVPDVAQNILIYPNPVEEELLVQNTNGSAAQVMIYDVIGRLVLTGNVLPSSTAVLDVQSLAPASYVVVCHFGDATIARRICKVQ